MLCGFSLIADEAVPVVFGEDWTPALEVFPYVAAAYLVMAAFALHNSLLYVLRTQPPRRGDQRPARGSPSPASRPRCCR